MAADESEYFSGYVGNGLSPVERANKKAATAKKAKAKSQKSPLASILQGITIGTVLLIPVGVWCWVRPAETIVTPAIEPEAASKTAGKAGGKRPAASAAKRKPVKPSVAALPQPALTRPPARIDAGRVDSGRPDPPAVVREAPVPASNLVPKAAAEEPEIFDSPAKPKKGVWKTLASPFRKNKTPPEQ